MLFALIFATSNTMCLNHSTLRVSIRIECPVVCISSVTHSSLTPGSGVLITTYAGVRIYRDLLLSRKWDYVVLDEGHKIRNPDAEVTLVCKQVYEIRCAKQTRKTVDSCFGLVGPHQCRVYLIALRLPRLTYPR